MLGEKVKKYKKVSKTSKRREELPLRGFLACSKCGETLTGSASRGRLGKRYFYYHCNHCCKERYSALNANKLFEKILESFKVGSSFQKLYQEILMTKLISEGVDYKQEQRKIQKQLEVEKKRLENLQDMLADQEICSQDYKEMKTRYTKNITDLNKQLTKIKMSQKGIKSFLNSGLDLLQNLSKAYKNSSVELKQRIIGSIFPEKLVFDKTQCRTHKINEAISLILNIDGLLQANKKGQQPKNRKFSRVVELAGIEPASKQ